MLPSSTGSLDLLTAEPALIGLNSLGDQIGEMDVFSKDPDISSLVLDKLRAAGLNTLPAVYVEVELLPRSDGLVLRPVLVWYRERLPGSPPGRTATEFHATLATPGLSADGAGIGTAFATARVSLPNLAPGDIVDWRTLAPYTSVIVPARPTAGAVDTLVARYNAAYTAVGTRQAELIAATRLQTTAARKNTETPNAENAAALADANQNVAWAQAALDEAKRITDALKSVDIGSTNVSARFVVVRDADRLGQAIATALKARSEAVDTAVTNAIDRGVGWNANETAYVEAVANVAAKQRAIDAAREAGTTDSLPSLLDELRILRAKVNEAAVATGRPAPYSSAMLLMGA
jgi:hypothetical protein